MAAWKGIVGKAFDPDGFDAYVRSLGKAPDWVQFVVLHNTSEPNLAQRTTGFTAQHMRNLEDYYKGQNWSGGPHLFIDDKQIWAFTPLLETGTHSPSWNNRAWGVEMLGEYEDEAFATGRGAQVAHNAVCALATLHDWAHLDSSTLHFHKEDPKTTHKSCPGKNVDKASVIKRLHDQILALRAEQAKNDK